MEETKEMGTRRSRIWRKKLSKWDKEVKKSWIKSSERWIDEVLKVCKENSQSGIQEVHNIV